ncbi:MAG: FtsQ-type POTRA domain-containing protein [Puniceicoccales bacterium]|nr:FtsQ-type POTRA domain-containing protein [Puniceicoccales bacterium]
MFKKLALWLSVGAIIIGLAYGSYLFLVERYPVLKQNIFTQPVRQIDFLSDGVLSAHWAKGIISVKKNIDIMDVDIFEIRDKFELFRQIKHVEVKRSFPDTIKIHIHERWPVLRVLGQENNRSKMVRTQMFIDSEGVIFQGMGYSREMVEGLPYLDAAMIKKDKRSGQYECADGIDGVAELMSLARKKYPNIYSKFEVISCDKVMGKHAAPWRRIKLRCSFAKEVVFSDSNFEEQLEKLNFILSDTKVSTKLPVYRLDVTAGKEVVVKFRDDNGGK